MQAKWLFYVRVAVSITLLGLVLVDCALRNLTMELSGVIHFLGDLLGQVIEQVESADGFRLEERVRGLAK